MSEVIGLTVRCVVIGWSGPYGAMASTALESEKVQFGPPLEVSLLHVPRLWMAQPVGRLEVQVRDQMRYVEQHKDQPWLALTMLVAWRRLCVTVALGQ